MRTNTVKAALVMAELPANMAWGDDDDKTLYMTARTGLYRIRLKIPGIRPMSGQASRHGKKERIGGLVKE
jgi:hypothetical protein